jgi:hypothetical protein
MHWANLGIKERGNLLGTLTDAHIIQGYGNTAFTTWFYNGWCRGEYSSQKVAVKYRDATLRCTVYLGAAILPSLAPS